MINLLHNLGYVEMAPKVYYKYKCGNVSTQNNACRNTSTPWNQESDSVHSLVMPDAKCNPDEYMTKFRLVRMEKVILGTILDVVKRIKIINQKIYTTNKRNDKSSYCTRTICFISYNYRDSFGCLFYN